MKDLTDYVKIKERIKALDKRISSLKKKVEEFVTVEGQGSDEKKVYVLENEIAFFLDRVKNSGRKLDEKEITKKLMMKGLNPDDYKTFKFDEKKLLKVLSEKDIEKATENPFTKKLSYKILGGV